MNYNVRFISYSGMSYNVREDCDREEAQTAVRAFLKRARKRGCYTSKIAANEWEVETPEDAAMIGDGEGFLKVTAKRSRRW